MSWDSWLLPASMSPRYRTQSVRPPVSGTTIRFRPSDSTIDERQRVHDIAEMYFETKEQDHRA